MPRGKELNRNRPSFAEQAMDNTKLGGSTERGMVLAVLALAEAIGDLAYEVAHFGTQAHPVHHRDVDR